MLFEGMDSASKVLHYYPNEQMDVISNAPIYPMTTSINTIGNTMTYGLSPFYQGNPMVTTVHDDDDDEVKRPMNSFLLWAKIMRKKYASENPNMHNAEISKLLGKIWNSMTSKDKRPFVEQAEKLRVLHMRTYPNYRYAPKRRKERRSNRMISPEVAAALHSTLFDVNNIISEQLSQNQIHGQDLKSYGYLRKVCEKNATSKTTENTDIPSKSMYSDNRMSPMSYSPSSSSSSSESSFNTQPESPSEHQTSTTRRKSNDSNNKSESMTLHYYPTSSNSLGDEKQNENSLTLDNLDVLANEQIHFIEQKHINNSDVTHFVTNEKRSCSMTSSVDKISGRPTEINDIGNTMERDNSIEDELPDFLKVLINTPLHHNEGQGDPVSFWSDIGDIISSSSL